MKKFHSKYIGNPELWIDFISEWQRRKGVNLSRNKEFNIHAYLENFPIDAPESYRHFMAAWSALGKPDLLLDLGSDEFFHILDPVDVECLAIFDSIGALILDLPEDQTLPMMLASDDYRNYSREQDNLFPLKAFFGNWVVADSQTIGGRDCLLLNPALRSIDGEWESSYVDLHGPFQRNFPSFAHLVAYLYMYEMLDDLDVTIDASWLSHEDDTSGLVRPLFAP